MAQASHAYLIPAKSSPGNYLIIPKDHAEDPVDLPGEWWQSVRELLPQVPGLGMHYNLSFNVGKLAGQSVKHLHLWVIPSAAGRPASGKGFARLLAEANGVTAQE